MSLTGVPSLKANEQQPTHQHRWLDVLKSPSILLPEFLIFSSHLEAAPEMWESCGKKSGLKKGDWGCLGPGLPTPAHRCRVRWQGFLPASWGLPASRAQFGPVCALLWWNGFSTLLIRTIMDECLSLFSATVKYFRRLNVGQCLLGYPLLPSFLLTWALFYSLFAAPCLPSRWLSQKKQKSTKKATCMGVVTRGSLKPSHLTPCPLAAYDTYDKGRFIRTKKTLLEIISCSPASWAWVFPGNKRALHKFNAPNSGGCKSEVEKLGRVLSFCTTADGSKWDRTGKSGRKETKGKSPNLVVLSINCGILKYMINEIYF